MQAALEMDDSERAAPITNMSVLGKLGNNDKFQEIVIAQDVIVS